MTLIALLSRRAIATSLLVMALWMAAPQSFAQTQKPLAILIPGMGGAIPIDFVVRNESRIREAGIDTYMTTSPSQATAAARAEISKGRKVVIVGMSRGGRMAADVIATGVPIAGVVLVAAPLQAAASAIGSPAKLPPALIIHHRHDGCQATPPSGVDHFQSWAGGRASVLWINTKGTDDNPRCDSRSAHGFYMQDRRQVSAIIEFIRSVAKGTT